jgi:riboflavin kinase/FMN adenylyltransferase
VKVFRGLDAVRPGACSDPVCSVGVFDGVHRGHRQLLYELCVWAKSVAGTPFVITFERHPLEVLKGIPVPEILSLENRLVELERHGVEAVLLLDFAAVKELPAEAFLREVLLEGIGCRRLLLGFDSHIGKGRDGTPATLPDIGAGLGIEVRIASRVVDKDGAKIGSRVVRQAIRAGDLELAANVLGRPVTARGHVIRGAGRGRGLGTATANLDVGSQVLPPDGVYLVRVFRGAETAPGVANLGVRPTFEQDGARTLEVHVPGWTGEMYGDTLEVRFVRRLRDERRFDDPAALKAQIQRDLDDLSQAVEDGEV